LFEAETIHVPGNIDGEEVIEIMESILTSIKKMLGITEEYEHFDSDLIIHINSVFMILTQLGVGPPSGFSIQDKSTTWKEFISDETKLQLVKSYMHMKVRLIFDPPLSSAVIASMEKMIAEAEWRLNVAAETDEEKSEEYESYDGEYRITPKAFQSQMLDTENKVLDRNIVVTEVPYYETGNAANGVTSYIAKEGDSK
jgi:hypothetical protein